jgi:hypothetical protein
MAELCKRNNSWDDFMRQNMFDLQPVEAVEKDIDNTVHSIDENLGSFGVKGFISHPKRPRNKNVVRETTTVKPPLSPPARQVTRNMLRKKKEM